MPNSGHKAKGIRRSIDLSVRSVLIFFKNLNSDSKFGRHSFSVDFFISMVIFFRNKNCIFASDPTAVLSRKGTP